MSTRRRILFTAASIALLGATAVPALADHVEDHPNSNCQYPTGPEGSGTAVVSGFTIWTGQNDGTVGYRTRDIYGYAQVNGGGASATVFQPYAAGGKVVDVSAKVGTDGSVTTCNKTVAP